MESDEDAVADHSMAWTTSGRLCNLSSDREDSVLVGDQPPDGITSLKINQLRILNTLEQLYAHQIWYQELVLELDSFVWV